MNSDEKKKFAPTPAKSPPPPPPASPQGAVIGDEPPFAYSSNDRLSLEKGILSVSLLLLMLTDIGNEELDGRIAMGLGIALDRLPGPSPGLFSPPPKKKEKKK